MGNNLGKITMENNETQNRRQFFKEAAKKALPIIGAVALMSNPVIAKAVESEPMGCSQGCTNGCAGGCSRSCQTTCSRGCRGGSETVGYGCEGCRSLCMGCTGGCSGSCSGSCSVTSYAL